MLILRHGVGDDDLVQTGVEDAFYTISAQHAMGDKSKDFTCTRSLEQLRSAGNGVGGVGEIIDHDADFALDITHKQQCRIAALGSCRAGNVFLTSLLVNKGELHAETVGYGGGSFGAAGVWRDYHAVVDTTMLRQDLVGDVATEQMTTVEVIHGNVEEALVLGIVQVHGDDVICSGASEEICHQRARLGDPLFVASLWLEVGWVSGATLSAGIAVIGNGRGGGGWGAIGDGR